MPRCARSSAENLVFGGPMAFAGASEEDAVDCRQVEAEVRGEIPAGPAEPSRAVAAPAEAIAGATSLERSQRRPSPRRLHLPYRVIRL